MRGTDQFLGSEDRSTRTQLFPTSWYPRVEQDVYVHLPAWQTPWPLLKEQTWPAEGGECDSVGEERQRAVPERDYLKQKHLRAPQLLASEERSILTHCVPADV